MTKDAFAEAAQDEPKGVAALDAALQKNAETVINEFVNSARSGSMAYPPVYVLDIGLREEQFDPASWTAFKDQKGNLKGYEALHNTCERLDVCFVGFNYFVKGDNPRAPAMIGIHVNPVEGYKDSKDADLFQNKKLNVSAPNINM